MLKNVVRWIIFLSFTLFIGGCVGDGGMTVTGSIVDRNGKPIEQCEIMLSYAKENKRIGQNEVQADFIEYFVISPFQNKYQVSIVCPGYRKKFKSDVFASTGATYDEKPLNLGVIVMSD